jgi:hypothetical protein
LLAGLRLKGQVEVVRLRLRGAAGIVAAALAAFPLAAALGPPALAAAGRGAIFAPRAGPIVVVPIASAGTGPIIVASWPSPRGARPKAGRTKPRTTGRAKPRSSGRTETRTARRAEPRTPRWSHALPGRCGMLVIIAIAVAQRRRIERGPLGHAHRGRAAKAAAVGGWRALAAEHAEFAQHLVELLLEARDPLVDSLRAAVGTWAARAWAAVAGAAITRTTVRRPSIAIARTAVGTWTPWTRPSITGPAIRRTSISRATITGATVLLAGPALPRPFLTAALAALGLQSAHRLAFLGRADRRFGHRLFRAQSGSRDAERYARGSGPGPPHPISPCQKCCCHKQASVR